MEVVPSRRGWDVVALTGIQDPQEVEREMLMTGWRCPKDTCHGACVERIQLQEVDIYRRWAAQPEVSDLTSGGSRNSPYASFFCDRYII